MKRLVLLVSLVALSASFLFAGGAFDRGVYQLEDYNVRVGALKGPTAFGSIQLFEETPSFGEGITSSYELMGTPQEMIARMTTGEIEAAVLPVNLAAKMYTAGPKYPMGGVVGNGMVFLLSREAAPTSLAGLTALAGLDVAVAGQGATPDYLMQFFLDKAGFSVNDIQPEYSLSAPQIAQSAIAGRIDTVIVPEPFATMIENRAPDMKRVFDFQRAWVDYGVSDEVYPMTAVVLSPDFVENHPQAAEAFLEAYADSIAWVNAHPADAAQLIEKYGVMSAAMAEPAIPHCNLTFVAADDSRAAVESYLSVLQGFNPASIGGTLPDADFYW